MRLTHKDEGENHYSVKPINKDTAFDLESIIKAYDKLGLLEDILEGHNIETLRELDSLLWYVRQIKNIEKEYGIELITLVKALKSGIHIIDDGYPYNDRVDLIYSSSIPCGFKGKVSDHCVFFKDYGKTWALTKEELK